MTIKEICPGSLEEQLSLLFWFSLPPLPTRLQPSAGPAELRANGAAQPPGQPPPEEPCGPQPGRDPRPPFGCAAPRVSGSTRDRGSRPPASPIAAALLHGREPPIVLIFTSPRCFSFPPSQAHPYPSRRPELRDSGAAPRSAPAAPGRARSVPPRPVSSPRLAAPGCSRPRVPHLPETL